MAEQAVASIHEHGADPETQGPGHEADDDASLGSDPAAAEREAQEEDRSEDQRQASDPRERPTGQPSLEVGQREGDGPGMGSSRGGTLAGGRPGGTRAGICCWYGCREHLGSSLPRGAEPTRARHAVAAGAGAGSGDGCGADRVAGATHPEPAAAFAALEAAAWFAALAAAWFVAVAALACSSRLSRSSSSATFFSRASSWASASMSPER